MTIKELKEILKDYNDNDVVVVEVFDTTLHEDLYSFYVDEIDGVMTSNGLVSEIRICPINHHNKN